MPAALSLAARTCRMFVSRLPRPTKIIRMKLIRSAREWSGLAAAASGAAFWGTTSSSCFCRRTDGRTETDEGRGLWRRCWGGLRRTRLTTAAEGRDRPAYLGGDVGLFGEHVVVTAEEALLG